MPWREALYPRLTQEVADALRSQAADSLASLEEIRAYRGCALELVCAEETMRTGLIMDEARMERLLAALSGYALYRFEREMGRGYLPLGGGHRAGVCGRMTYEDGAWRMGEVTSLCIRISREIPGVSGPIRRHLLDKSGRGRRVLFLGAPGCGKTTMLRDAAIYLSDEAGMRVAAADEREELFAQQRGGNRIDVLAGMDKARAMMMLLRSMAPEVIVTDEIGREEDTLAIEDAARCGIGLLVSVHAGSLAQCQRRPVLRRLMDGRVFERYILLDRRSGCLVCRVWDEEGRQIRQEEETDHDELGRGSDGNDRRQRDCFSDFGWGTAACALDSGDAQMSAADERNHPL